LKEKFNDFVNIENTLVLYVSGLDTSPPSLLEERKVKKTLSLIGKKGCVTLSAFFLRISDMYI
jgi:hypothetical protein